MEQIPAKPDNKPDEYNVLIEYPIGSTVENGKKRDVFIKFCQLVYRTGKSYFTKSSRINRIEIQLARENETPYTVTLSIRAFKWVLECIAFENAEIHLPEDKKSFNFSR